MDTQRSSTSSNKSPNSSASTPQSASGLASGATQPIPKKSQQIKTDKPRPHICSICTRAFARLEHLKRHERSHTNEKPFQCAVCGRCFARRDLVLRHQQKLHGSLPNIMRRGSSKDMDINEHVIVLTNNTDANAPLPASLNLDGSLALSNGINSLSPGQSQLFSPPKSNEYGGPNNANNVNMSSANNNANQSSQHQQGQLRTSLFNHLNSYTLKSQMGNNQYPGATNNGTVIPSPIPTNSNHNTPPNLAHQNTNTSLPNVTQQPSPQAGDSPNKHTKQYSNIPPHLRQQQSQYRHASFSASSATSYTNVKDSLDILQNNTIAEAPEQVEFATPQLSAMDMHSKRLISELDLHSLGLDIDNIDSLDLGHNTHHPAFNQLPHSSTHASKPIPKDSSYAEQELIAAHQFQNPNHPHHIKGTTPIDPDMYAPNDANMMQHMLQMNGINSEASFENLPSLPKYGARAGFALNSAVIQEKQKRKSNSTTNSTDRKRLKTDISIQSGDDWLEDMINAPFASTFFPASYHAGFEDSVDFVPGQIDDISSLFRARQVDLQQINPSNYKIKDENESDINVAFSINDSHSNFITEELRNRIILVSNLSNLQFPSLEELNSYMKLYEKEFNKFFPFIHLPSLKNPMVDCFENIPLLLAMGTIGALYSYHDNNSLLLFNLSKSQIQQFFEKEVTTKHLELRKIPLIVHQCLILHIFIAMFLNEPDMVDITSKQMKSMVGLIKSTDFNKPLERFLVPPSQFDKKDPGSIQSNFDYFIMAQSRVRTLNCFYMLEVFRTSLIRVPIQFSALNVSCGTHCLNENLWRSNDSSQWVNQLTNNTQPLIDLSNGESLQSMIGDLNNHYHDTKISFYGLLSLLMYIHEQIHTEVLKYKQFNSTLWRLNSRPRLESLIKSWESIFIKNGGILVVNGHNNHLLNANNEFKIILPLYSLAKINICMNITPIMERVLYKDWNGMNQAIFSLDDDKEALKECVLYSTEILSLWTHNVSIVDDSKRTSLRTPVFFVTCVFASVMIISHYLYSMEETKAQGLSPSKKSLWMKCETLLQAAEKVLPPIGDTKNYSEFLKNQFAGVSLSDINTTKKLISSNSNEGTIIASIKKSKLSVKCLYLGLHMLADTSIWPLAIGFAEALKNRATYITNRK